MASTRRPKKLLVIGMDGAYPKAIRKYMNEGVLPNISKLVEAGVFCENCYCPTPTITPPNWTTIATGASVGTHGITCFHYHPAGTPLDTIIQNFDSERVRAEYLWEAAEKVDKKCLVLNYITAWPPRGQKAIHIGGRAGSGSAWYYPGLPGWIWQYKYGLPQMYTTEIEPLSTRVEFREAEDGASEVELPISCQSAAYPVAEMSWRLRLQDGSASLLDEERRLVCPLAVGQWTDPVPVHIRSQDEWARCTWKLVSLDVENESLVLYRSVLQNLSANAAPEGIAATIDTLPCVDHETWSLLFIDFEKYGGLYVEEEHLHHEWLAAVVDHCVRQQGVEVAFLHSHTMDNVNHPLRNYIEGTAADCTPEKQRVAEEIERQCYISYDKMVAQMLQTMGSDAMVVLVSDHGAIATQGGFNANDALKAAGLLATKTGADGHQEIDWSRTQAIAQRSSYVYVNLQGRDPEGIVEPKDLEGLKNRIVNALMDATDPASGLKPVAYALKREEARWIGIYGEDVGDVVYALRAPFGGAIGGVHGMQAPFAESEQGSMKSLLILKGPGIKKGVALERNVELQDIVPTACYLLGLPLPRDVDGGIIYQALENPDLHLDEIRALQEALAKMERMIDYKKAQTHTY